MKKQFTLAFYGLKKGFYSFKCYTRHVTCDYNRNILQMGFSTNPDVNQLLQQLHKNINIKQDVLLKHNAPDNGQFQRRPRSQGQRF